MRIATSPVADGTMRKTGKDVEIKNSPSEATAIIITRRWHGPHANCEPLISCCRGPQWLRAPQSGLPSR